MSCACMFCQWYVRVSTRVRKGMPPSLQFGTASGRCVSLLTVLPVMVCVCAVVCACMRAGVSSLYCSHWGALRRARAVLRASRVMREAVHACVR